MNLKLFLPSILLLLSGCSETTKESEFLPLPKEQKIIKEIDTIPDRIKTTAELHDSSGAAGVYEVGKMLALTVRDSSDLQHMAQKMSRAFTQLELEVKALGLKASGAPGCITFSDDPNNTVFECLIPLDSIPKKKPRFCNVAIIKGEDMLIYNHYGEYGKIDASYRKIISIMKKSGLLKTGPLREFYITDPATEQDTSKWLTRIMVPVMKKANQ